jgi:hypothetical protein
MATLTQTIANRLNALRSTGPKTPEGKARSGRNALKHGLSRIGMTPPSGMADAIADRKQHWSASYGPEGPAQEWLFERLVAESVRLDCCERRLLVARAELAERAAESWDDDRSAEVAELAAKLPDRPELVQPKLLQSKHGVLWLIERWGDVAADLNRRDGWTPENWFLALDLLGVPIEGRKHSGPWELDPNDSTAGPGLQLARDGVAALQARLDAHLDDRDARARERAELGLGLEDAPPIRLLERYAADARRQISRCTDELRRQQAASGESPASRPSPEVAPVPSPLPPRPVRSPRPRPRPGSEAPTAGPTPEMNPASSAPVAAEAGVPADLPGAEAEASPKPAAMARDLPGRSPFPGLRDRLSPAPAPNRRARRALAASARRG